MNRLLDLRKQYLFKVHHFFSFGYSIWC